MKKIKLTKGMWAIVDDEDFSFLTNGNFIWRFSTTGYAEDIKKRSGKANHTLMHRIINQTPSQMETDHINGNKLDNRKLNLRSVNAAQNQWNRNNIKGIYFHSKSKKWIARIMVNRVKKHLGSFKIKEDALKVYQDAVREKYREYASINLQKKGEKL